jgi:hypothetical protein
MKKIINFKIAILLFTVSFITFPVKVVGLEYKIGISTDDTFIWEIDKLDEDIYEEIFVTDTSLEEGDQSRIEIDFIEESSEKWRIFYFFWDYTEDSRDFEDRPDDYKTRKTYKDPEDQGEKINDLEDFSKMWIIPNPSVEYIEEFKDEYDNDFYDVSVDDNTLRMKPAIENLKYEIDITFGDEGVANLIEYINEDGEIFLRIILLERTIPGYDISFILVSILLGGVAIIFLSKRRLIIINT